MKKKENKEQVRKMLLGVGRKYVEPLKHVEFKCPYCGGIATVHIRYDKIIAECHAENLWASQRV